MCYTLVNGARWNQQKEIGVKNNVNDNKRAWCSVISKKLKSSEMFKYISFKEDA